MIHHLFSRAPRDAALPTPATPASGRTLRAQTAPLQTLTRAQALEREGSDLACLADHFVADEGGCPEVLLHYRPDALEPILVLAEQDTTGTPLSPPQRAVLARGIGLAVTALTRSSNYWKLPTLRALGEVPARLGVAPRSHPPMALSSRLVTAGPTGVWLRVALPPPPELRLPPSERA